MSKVFVYKIPASERPRLEPTLTQLQCTVCPTFEDEMGRRWFLCCFIDEAPSIGALLILDGFERVE